METIRNVLFSEPMCYPFGNDASHINLCHFQIVQHIFDSLRMMTIVCYLVSDSRVSSIRDFNSVNLLFFGT
jgi:hypothetical protein